MTKHEELILLAKSALAMKAQAARDYKWVVDQLPGKNKTHAIRRLLGLCPECGELATAGFYCQTHRDQANKRARKENEMSESKKTKDERWLAQNEILKARALAAPASDYEAGCHDAAAMVPCGLCKTPTPMTGTKLCNRCWELKNRIVSSPELAAKILNSINGSVRSKAKTAAARANGKAGGRPTLPPGVKGKYERRTA